MGLRDTVDSNFMIGLNPKEIGAAKMETDSFPATQMLPLSPEHLPFEFLSGIRTVIASSKEFPS